MSANNSSPSGLRFWLCYRPYIQSWRSWANAVLLAGALLSLTSVAATGETAKHVRVSGAGKTIIEGGTGGATPSPVTTLVAFHADAGGGDFECLAFTSSMPSGPNSGDFDVNAMYVTGKVTSLEIIKDGAILHGTATVTGLGAGQGLPFTAAVHDGGPGTTIRLDISGLTFPEILVDGHITIEHSGGD